MKKILNKKLRRMNFIGNNQYCNKINHAGYKNECLRRVVFRKVVLTKDIKYCQVLIGEDKKICKGLGR